jgi:rhodanese-related sulfurtransferase
MGYDAVNMKYGMTAWTMDEDIRVASPYNEETGADYDTETDENTVSADNELPALDVTDSEDEDEIIRAAVAAYLSADTPPVITAEDLFELLNDGDETNDPFIVSVRGPDDYAKGHIPGAINIPWKSIAKLENLGMIPTDRQVVIYCYTGHTGGLATTVLNVLGYDAINMKFGIMAWTKDADVRAQSAFTEETEANDYPTEP